MAESLADLRHVRSWYGLEGELAVEDRLWHLVRIGHLRLVHPAVANLVLRAGLPEQDRYLLSYLQTLPVAVAHALLLMLAGWRRRARLGWLSWLLAITVAHQATWELASESYVLVSDLPGYRDTYRRHWNPLVTIFWATMAGLGLGLSWSLLKRR